MSRAHDAVRTLIRLAGENPAREGLVETPERFIQALKFWTSGYGQDPEEVLKTFEDGADSYDQMVVQTDIPLWSLCEHHLAPFFGVAHIAYIPNGRVVGLSKLTRLVDVYARRLQVQERITTQVARDLQAHLEPKGVGVILECRHSCMESRGVQKAGTVTRTSALLGAMADEDSCREEFIALAQSRKM